MIGLETAGELLDFRGRAGAISERAAREQLEGAVALHNVLARRRVAYLADEVGMGKTYVALGAVALFRHFDPRFRLLVIAPRQNIQEKWMKELRNFVRGNVTFPDLRVKAVHGAPARAAVACHSLIELVREAGLNPDRDFFARLTSFSLPVGGGRDSIERYRDQLAEHLPFLPREQVNVDLRQGAAVARFKDNFARALCGALPVFDLVIVDEGHNLKHGFGAGVAARNRVLALTFGHPAGQAKGFPGYGPRARRVLFLSATPLENDYAQLWNQLDVFGLGDLARPLVDEKRSDEEKRACAQEFLIRRVTSMTVGDARLTKNLYRREWRKGGVTVHDEALQVLPADRDRQRLVVALVQKKVTEILGHERFNNSFQIGMLASFESFLETAKVRKKGDEEDTATFDDADQADALDERLGVDVGEVNKLARSYRRRFGKELPHPKMDALVEHLAEGLPRGRKALVFVRRVASVKELQAKLEEHYDDGLIARLRTDLPADLARRVEGQFDTYREERAARRQRQLTALASTVDELEEEEDAVFVATPAERDTGGLDSFFAWFFRGDGPPRILSGAALQRRFTQPSSAYSTFFEDNYVAWLLNVQPGEGRVLTALARYLDRPLPAVVRDLVAHVEPLLPTGRSERRIGRLYLFLALQDAGLALLAETAGPLQEQAKVIRQVTQGWGTGVAQRGASAPTGAEQWLDEPTFFSELRSRTALRNRLWPDPSGEPGAREAFREQELRRLLLSSMARLGHAFIDLWVLAVRRLGTLAVGAREDEGDGMRRLIADYLDALEAQMGTGGPEFRAFAELSLAAEHFGLILSVSQPDLWTMPLPDAVRVLGTLLGRQQPIAGMFGEINKTVVRQFRLPGYPFVLFTTDLLQEGEDLHTFCSSVHHYGISWMPSSMEQRVGRIDRVNSETERRLTRSNGGAGGEHKLQVYYPHLRDTVEVLQVRRVLGRLNRFMRLMHRDLLASENVPRRLDIAEELHRFSEDVDIITEPLTTAFPIRPELLAGTRAKLAVDPAATAGHLARFHRIKELIFPRLSISWEASSPEDALLGTVHLRRRQQPFTLLLRSLGGRLMVRCVSPIGKLGERYDAASVAEVTRTRAVQVAAIFDPRFQTYDLAIERETLLAGEPHDLARVDDLLEDVVEAADLLEARLLERDEPLATFRKDLEREADHAD